MKKIKNLLLKLKTSRFFRIKALDRQTILITSLILLVISNILISRISIRLDLSKGKAYTLSPATKKILGKLDDIVHVTFYVSADLPSRLLPIKTEVIDMLGEYAKESGNKVTLKILDPKKDEKALKEVNEMGIPELQFSELQKDKYQLTSSYFGLGILHGDELETLPQATDLTNLEYNITSLIYKLTVKETVTIGALGMDDVSDPQNDPYLIFKTILSQQYEVIPLNLQNDTIDNSYKTIILTDTNGYSYTEDEINKIKKYIESGGKMIFFIDGVWVDDNLAVNPAGHNLFTLLKEWGIGLNQDLVLSPSAEFVNFGNDVYQFLTPYPFWLKTNNLNRKAEYFANVEELTFPWTSSLSLDKKAESTLLISSPSKSWTQKNDFELMPQNIPQPIEKDLRAYPLAVEVKTKQNGTVVVISSSRFINARYLSKNTANIDFVFNLVNNAASDGALSGIRSRSVNFYSLPDLSDNQKELLKYINILVLPLLFGLYGVWRLFKRK
ncbi:MAG: GldG family protein [Patescibacteria group bacterium]